MGSIVASCFSVELRFYLRVKLGSSLASAFASREFKLEDSKLRVLVSPTEVVSTIISKLVPRVNSRSSSTVASKLNSRISATLNYTLRNALDLALFSSIDSVSESRLNPALESVLISLPSIMDGEFGSCVYSSSRFCDLLAQKLFEELDVEYKSNLNMITSDALGDATLDQLMELDRLMLQAEKKSMFCDVVGRIWKGILPTLDRICFRPWNLHPDLRPRQRSLDAQVRFLENSLALYNLLAGESGSGLDLATTVLVSAIILSAVYQYLIGYVDKGGTKTYNSGSLDFRATYVSLMLFRAAYVWIKFRDVALRTVSRRSRIDASGNRIPIGKWLPKFKPPRERGQSFNCLELAGYATKREAEVAWQMAAFYYGKDERRVEMEDSFWFDIPLMPEQDLHRSGENKRKWVTDKAKEVFKNFKEEYDQWGEFLSILLKQPTEQGVGRANYEFGHTPPQPLSDLDDFLIATPAGIQVTRTGSSTDEYDFQLPENLQSSGIHQEVSSAQLASISNDVESGSDVVGNHQQPLADVLTPVFMGTVEVLTSRGTEEDLVGVTNKHGEMQDLLRELRSVLFEKDEEQIAGSVSIHQECGMENIQHQSPVLANQVHDPSLHNHTVPQPPWGVSESLDAFREQPTITTQADLFWQASMHEFGEPVGAGGIDYEALFASTEDNASSLPHTFCTFSSIEDSGPVQVSGERD